MLSPHSCFLQRSWGHEMSGRDGYEGPSANHLGLRILIRKHAMEGNIKTVKMK